MTDPEKALDQQIADAEAAAAEARKWGRQHEENEARSRADLLKLKRDGATIVQRDQGPASMPPGFDETYKPKK